MDEEPHSARAEAALARGDLNAAAKLYRRAIERRTKNPHAYNNLGVILAQRGDLDSAIPLFRRALALAALVDSGENLTRALGTRGSQHFHARRFEDAVVDFREVGVLNPLSATAATDLGATLAGLGRHPEAIELFQRAIALAPDDALANSNLGSSLFALGRIEEAANAQERALALAPNHPTAAVNLSAVEERRGNISRAEALARRAIELAPDLVEAHNNLGLALSSQGELEETLASFRRAVELAPKNPAYHSALLLNLNYDPDLSPHSVATEHRRFFAIHGQTPPASASRVRFAGSSRRLRVGYLSPDLRAHSVSYFFEPLLRAHDREAVEVTCYSDVPRPDAVTQRFEALSEHWRSVAFLDDVALKELVRNDGIDVLVDLAGHTARNRMRLFASRAAPIQVTYLGYPNTTGLATMDCRISDAIADPEGLTDGLHTERLVRIAGGFLCYSPHLTGNELPPVAPPPSASIAAVTFGSFNNLAKMNHRVFEAWASLLRRIPDSRLLLKARGLGEDQIRQRIWSRFQQRGIEQDRIDLVAPADRTNDHLATYGRVDIALDTFPYNGTTTTCEALWMGVPVVSFAGSVHAGRVGTSILTSVGLAELAPATLDASLDLAAELAADRDRLVDLRRNMRDRMLASPLMDARRLAGHLEAAYRIAR